MGGTVQFAVARSSGTRRRADATRFVGVLYYRMYDSICIAGATGSASGAAGGTALRSRPCGLYRILRLRAQRGWVHGTYVYKWVTESTHGLFTVQCHQYTQDTLHRHTVCHIDHDTHERVSGVSSHESPTPHTESLTQTHTSYADTAAPATRYYTQVARVPVAHTQPHAQDR